MSGLVDRTKAARTSPIFRLLIAFFIAYAVLAAPYVLHNSLQDTGFVSSVTNIKVSDVPAPANLYLNQGTQYWFYILRQPSSAGGVGVISPQQKPLGSLVYVNSSLAQWYIQSYPLPINVGQSYNRLIIASSLKEVPQSVAGLERTLTQSLTGQAVLGISTIFALGGPLLFVLLFRFIARRYSLWSVVGAAWTYAALYFAIGVTGSGYGTAVSFTLAAGLVFLLVVGYVVNKAETYVRGRLGSAGTPA